MLYEMTTGQVPFHADQAVQVLLKVISETPRRPRELNPDLSAAMEVVVLKAIEKKPGDRYQKAADLARAFATALKPRPETVQKPRGATAPSPSVKTPPETRSGFVRLKVMHGDLFETADVFLNLEGSVLDAITSILKDRHWPATTSSGRPLMYRLYRRAAPGQPLPGGAVLKTLSLAEGETVVLEREELESGEARERKEAPAQSPAEVATEIIDATCVFLQAEDGRRFTLTQGAMNVGRADTARGIPDIDLTRYDRDNSVSRQHARIVWRDHGYYVQDANSVNGVQVNGTLIPPETPQRLAAADRVQFGDVVLTFQEIKKDR
jgi:hypothetical protein